MEDYNERGGKMEIGKIIMWTVIGVLVIAVVYTTFISGGSSGAEIAGAATRAPSSGGMVGGC